MDMGAGGEQDRNSRGRQDPAGTTVDAAGCCHDRVERFHIMPSCTSGGGTAARPVLRTALASALLVSSAVVAAVFFASKWKDDDPLSDAISFPSANSNSNSNSTAPVADDYPSAHDPLIPLQSSDYVGFVCASLGLVLAAGGGVGGGGILVPIYVLILGFMPKHAIPLSNVTVFGGAVANTLRNVRKRHPSADRPLIDWDLILVMEPPTLAGALVGANLNKILPETAIAVLLVVLLALTAFNTLKKARKMHRRETEEIERRNVGTRTLAVDATTMVPESKLGSGGMNEYFVIDQDTETEEILSSEEGEVDSGILVIDQDTESEEILSSEEGEVDSRENKDYAGLSLHDLDSDLSSAQLSDDDEEKKDGVDEESDSSFQGLPECGRPESLELILEMEKHPKRKNIFLVGVLFCVVLLINILKGGGGFASPLGIECGSTAFWLAQALLLVWVLSMSWLGRRLLLKDAQRKADAGYVYLDEDLKWDRRSTVIYPLISTLAGFCAGMFGIGGGIIKGPLMIAMGIHPAVASATSACMILFTSFTATTTFSVYGLMVPDYAIAGGILGFSATMIGQLIMARLLAKSNRNSYIAFCIGFVVLLSAVLMALESVLRLISEEDDKAFGGICDAHLNGHNT